MQIAIPPQKIPSPLQHHSCEQGRAKPPSLLTCRVPVHAPVLGPGLPPLPLGLLLHHHHPAGRGQHVGRTLPPGRWQPGPGEPGGGGWWAGGGHLSPFLGHSGVLEAVSFLSAAAGSAGRAVERPGLHGC